MAVYLVTLATAVAVGNRSADAAQWTLMTAIVAVPVVIRLATLAHELGHAAAGLAAGGRILALAVRPVEWQPPFTFRRSHGDRKGGNRYGGYTICRFATRRGHRYGFYVVGGIVANLLVAGGAGVGIALLAPSVLRSGLAVLAVWSLWQAMSSAVPYEPNDGTQLLRLARTAARRRRWRATYNRPPSPPI